MMGIQNPFEWGKKRYSPDKQFTRGDNPEYIISQRFFASFIGVAAIGLPVLLVIAAMINGCFYDSISHNYYARLFGDIFVITLAVIGIFLLAYRGRHPKENQLATFAGISALTVALLPTAGPGVEGKVCAGRALYLIENQGPVGPFYQLFPGVEFLHLVAAAFLFGFLAYYSLVVFTREVNGENRLSSGELTANKKTRNTLYLWSGLMIIACMLALLSYAVFGKNWTFWNKWNLTFWLESVALVAFGVSWVVKGRFFGKVLLDADDVQSQDGYAGLSYTSIWRFLSSFAAFLASAFAIYQGFVHFFPPSQAIVGFKNVATFDELEIAKGGNRGFGTFIRTNIDKRVFINFAVPRLITKEYIDTICNIKPALQPARAEKGNYVLWHLGKKVDEVSELRGFCKQVKKTEGGHLDFTIFEVAEDPKNRACGTIQSSSGGILHVLDNIVGFYRIERGPGFSNMENYVLRADIPTGPEYDDTVKKLGPC